MTGAEAEAILGPELTAQIQAQARNAPPLTRAQIVLLAALLAVDPDQAIDAA